MQLNGLACPLWEQFTSEGKVCTEHISQYPLKRDFSCRCIQPFPSLQENTSTELTPTTPTPTSPASFHTHNNLRLPFTPELPFFCRMATDFNCLMVGGKLEHVLCILGRIFLVNQSLALK